MTAETRPKLVRQKTPTTCGQACVAMVLECSFEDAVAHVGHDGITSDDEIATAVGAESMFRDGKPPADVVAIQKHREPNGKREHWTVSWKGKTLDPACIGSRLWPVSKYVVIDWMDEVVTEETIPCLLCDKQLQCAVNDWSTMQPYGGGEVRFVFSFGSCEFDYNSGSTEFRALICDDCAKKYVDKMERMGRAFGEGETAWLPPGTPLERGA